VAIPASKNAYAPTAATDKFGRPPSNSVSLPPGIIDAPAPMNMPPSARRIPANEAIWSAPGKGSALLLARSQTVSSLRERPMAHSYHTSVSAAIMGIAGGMLYATVGAWSYTNFLRMEVAHRLGSMMAPMAWHALLVVALLAGMVSAVLP